MVLAGKGGARHVDGKDQVLGKPDRLETEAIRRNPQFGLRSLRLARALEPAFVITVEPGIYFIPELIDQWQAEGKHTAFIDYAAVAQFKDFGGIRIEDDLVVTSEGSDVLSAAMVDCHDGYNGVVDSVFTFNMIAPNTRPEAAMTGTVITSGEAMATAATSFSGWTGMGSRKMSAVAM